MERRLVVSHFGGLRVGKISLAANKSVIRRGGAYAVTRELKSSILWIVYRLQLSIVAQYTLRNTNNSHSKIIQAYQLRRNDCTKQSEILHNLILYFNYNHWNYNHCRFFCFTCRII